MTPAAFCLSPTCPWSVEATAAEVDVEARRHSGELAGGPGHATCTSATGAVR